MIKAEFAFKNNQIFIMCNEDDKMEEVCKRFGIKAETDLKNLVFLYGGIIDLNKTVSSIMNKFDKERKIFSIVVDDLSKQNSNKPEFVKSIIPICPKCYENVEFDIINFKINLSECKNGHKINMLINEYEQSQRINLNKIICDGCKTKKLDIFENQMYYCNKCKKVFCPLCKAKDDKTHNAINYDLKNYICEMHNELYNSYCKSCKINICLKCQKAHLQHDIIGFGTIFPDVEELLNSLKEFRNIIDVFNNDINNIIERLNKVKVNIEKIYQIYYEMVTKYDDKNRNYEAFMSLNNIKNNSVMKALKNINQIKNFNDKVNNIFIIYEQMNQLNQQKINNIQNNKERNCPNNDISSSKSSSKQENKNDLYHSEMLKHLLRFSYFKKELKS